MLKTSSAIVEISGLWSDTGAQAPLVKKACFPGVSKGVIVWEWVNSLPNDNFRLVQIGKLETFSDDKINITQIFKFIFRQAENIEGK